MIVLIIPCYNEEARLRLQEFAVRASPEMQFVFVDDGSRDKTAELIESFATKNPFIHLVRMPQNGGKAAAVRYGMLQARTKFRFADEDWVGFWDADLATPLTEISKMILYSASYGEVDSIWASRIYRLGSHVQRSAVRHYLGRVFATLIGTLLKVRCYDSQCGAKLFKASVLNEAFEEVFLSNWIFDVEILLRLHNYKIIEYPVTEWTHIAGSKVQIFREVFRVFFDILKIRKKYFSVIAKNR